MESWLHRTWRSGMASLVQAKGQLIHIGSFAEFLGFTYSLRKVHFSGQQKVHSAYETGTYALDRTSSPIRGYSELMHERVRPELAYVQFAAFWQLTKV